MVYFNGFALKNEEIFFDFWLKDQSYFSIAGFSYGAIKAFKYALESNKRVDRLIFLSPAFFQDLPKDFKLKEIENFKRSKEVYLKRFLRNVAYPLNINLKDYFREPSINELEELLFFRWEKEKLKELKDRGIIIEVIVGEKDKIVSSKRVIEFFEDIAKIYIIKEGGHLLKPLCKEQDE